MTSTFDLDSFLRDFRGAEREAEERLSMLVLPDDLTDGNPYLDVFLSLSGGRPREFWDDPFPMLAQSLLRRARRSLGTAEDGLVRHFAWAVPTDQALHAVGATGEVVEIGAGGGYWAALLRTRGVVVHAYDKTPEPSANNYVAKVWTDVKRGGAAYAAHHPEATLFLCWPVMDGTAYSALDRYLDAGGSRVVYAGEHEGGCCASTTFFEALERKMTPVEEVAIPQFPFIHDYLSVWERE